MGLRILDWFGFDLDDHSPAAQKHRNERLCPFIAGKCTKLFRDGTRSAVCTVSLIRDQIAVPICPNRLYADDYVVLKDVAVIAFGKGHKVIPPDQHRQVHHDGRYVVAFGHKFGRELRLPSRTAGGKYYVDWVLARIDKRGNLSEFVAVEIQSIDTTGSLRPEVEILRTGQFGIPQSVAGLNWENVNKRILPQIIYKGHVLRGEPLCRQGLFFITPAAVHERILTRLGRELLTYSLQPGSITFLWYQLGDPVDGTRPLSLAGQHSTTVDQVALAFTSPADLPPEGVYEDAIREALSSV